MRFEGKATTPIKSALKVFVVLDVLLRNFAHGFSAKELIQATGFAGSDITRYVNTLLAAGFAERIAETGRIRPSHSLGQKAVQILRSLDMAEQGMRESINRLNK